MFSKEGHILIVEDILPLRKMIKRAFVTLGFKNVIEAADGEQAWQIMNKGEFSFDLVCSDWTMPKCTGLELMARMRTDPKLSYIPFLLLTGNSGAAEVDTALQAGVDSYLMKPFSAVQLEKCLKVTYRRSSERLKAGA